MRAFSKSTKICAVAALGVSLTLSGVGIAQASTAPIPAAASAQAADYRLAVTSSLEPAAGTAFDIEGRALPNSTVTIVGLPGQFVVETTADAAGRFVHRVMNGLPVGVHRVDLGNPGNGTIAVEFRVAGADGTVPGVAPIVATSEPTYRFDRPAVLEGTALPGRPLSVKVPSLGESATVAVDAAGKWRWQSARPFSGTTRTVELLQQQAGGVAKASVEMTVDADVFRPLTVDEPSYVPGQKVRLSGTATPAGVVNVRASSVGIDANVTAGPDGKWSYESRVPVSGLEHQVRVRQVAANDAGIVVTLKADASSFKPLTVDEPSWSPGETVRLSGTATPNGAVNVSASSAGIYENVTAGADGKWSYESRAAVSGLEHKVRVRQSAANDAGIVVTLRALDENGATPVFRPLAVTSGTTFVPGATTRLTGTATPWSEIAVTLTNPGKPLPGLSSERYRTNAAADGTWSVEIPNHRLISAKVQQGGQLGNETITFEFSR